MNSPFVATAGDDDLLGELEGLVGPDEPGDEFTGNWNAADEQDYVDLVGEPSGQDIDQPPPAEPEPQNYFSKYEDATSRVNKLYDEMQARKAKEAEEAAKKAAEEKAYEEDLYKSLHEASEQLEFRPDAPRPQQDYTFEGETTNPNWFQRKVLGKKPEPIGATCVGDGCR